MSHTYNRNEPVRLKNIRLGTQGPLDDPGLYILPVSTSPETFSDIFYVIFSEEEGEAPIPTVIDAEEPETSKSRPCQKTITDSAYNSFWQYRREPKGPRGLKFEIEVLTVVNPHEPIKFRDPAFTEGKKLTLTHFGKPRVGEGKLLQLGNEIDELIQKMSKLGDTSTDRKEKMKISGK